MPNVPTNATATVKLASPGCATVAWEKPAAAANGAEKPADAANAASYEVVALPTMTVHTTSALELKICSLEHGAQYSFEVRTVEDGAKSDPATTGSVKIPGAAPGWWWFWSGIVLAL